MFQWLPLFYASLPVWGRNLLVSVVTLAGLFIARQLACHLMRKRVHDPTRAYHVRRAIMHVYYVLAILLVGRIWMVGHTSLATFFGLASAGLAIAMHDVIANLAGWLFIITRRPFNLGDRIQIGDQAGDVIDVRVLQFSVVEIGNWVHADQSTGRIVHIPNSLVLREPLANYETGFAYIWLEIPVLVTFESNWREAKRILSEIAREKTEHLSADAQAQIRRAAMQYLVYFKHLGPIVYTKVEDSGILLTIRYIVDPRQRRVTEAEIWEAILDAFGKREDIVFAYPTTRFYGIGEQAPGQRGSGPRE